MAKERKTSREIWGAYWKKKWEEDKKKNRGYYHQGTGYHFIGKQGESSMTKVSYLVTYPTNERKIVKTYAEAQEVKALGGTYKVIYSKIRDKG